MLTSDPERRGFSILDLIVRIDLANDTYSRQVYSLSQLLSDVGGVNSILFLFGAFIARLPASKIFTAAIVKEIYQVKQIGKKDMS
jgi:hypothetical protein